LDLQVTEQKDFPACWLVRQIGYPQAEQTDMRKTLQPGMVKKLAYWIQTMFGELVAIIFGYGKALFVDITFPKIYPFRTILISIWFPLH
jgi:hypothetical protein